MRSYKKEGKMPSFFCLQKHPQNRRKSYQKLITVVKKHNSILQLLHKVFTYNCYTSSNEDA